VRFCTSVSSLVRVGAGPCVVVRLTSCLTSSPSCAVIRARRAHLCIEVCSRGLQVKDQLLAAA